MASPVPDGKSCIPDVHLECMVLPSLMGLSIWDALDNPRQPAKSAAPMGMRKRDGSRERVNRSDSAIIDDAALDKAIVAMSAINAITSAPIHPKKV